MMSTQNLNIAQTNNHGLDNWRELHIDQQPTWSEHEDFASTIAELNSVPPLVFAGEVDAMRQALGEVARIPAAGRRLCRNLCGRNCG